MILERTYRKKRPEKEGNTYFMKMWTWSLSCGWKSIRQFQQAIHVPPFEVDDFETRDWKLVYNVLKDFKSHINFQLTRKFY